jgi:hypothetical protein
MPAQGREILSSDFAGPARAGLYAVTILTEMAFQETVDLLDLPPDARRFFIGKPEETVAAPLVPEMIPGTNPDTVEVKLLELYPEIMLPDITGRMAYPPQNQNRTRARLLHHPADSAPVSINRPDVFPSNVTLSLPQNGTMGSMRSTCLVETGFGIHPSW